MRKPRVRADGADWIGQSVLYRAFHKNYAEEGVVVEMSDSKHLAMWVKFDNKKPILVYAKYLERINADNH